MLRICDICGAVDELPRHVIGCTPQECPPVNQAMVLHVISMTDIDEVTKAAVIQDLHDNTLMLRHLTQEEWDASDVDFGLVECVPFVSQGS